MTSGGNNFNDFTENQLTNVCVVYTEKIKKCPVTTKSIVQRP